MTITEAIAHFETPEVQRSTRPEDRVPLAMLMAAAKIVVKEHGNFYFDSESAA